MATEPFLGEIRCFSFNFPPKGWAQCSGQLLAISQNQALFAVIGTFYGGNGTTNFALPNLQGRVPLHTGQGITIGQVAGESSVTLLQNQIGHTHLVNAAVAATVATAGGNFPATVSSGNAFGTTLDSTMNPGVISPVGGNLPHNNMQPYLVLNYCIALNGIFPTRN